MLWLRAQGSVVKEVHYLSIFYFHLIFAAIESIDITRILSQQDGEAVYPLPRIKYFVFHPKLNLAALLFAVSI